MIRLIQYMLSGKAFKRALNPFATAAWKIDNSSTVCGFVLFMFLAVISLPSHASDAWSWKVGILPGQVFDSQGEAERALRSIDDRTALLKEITVMSMDQRSAVYRYSATPKKPEIRTEWAYIHPSGGSPVESLDVIISSLEGLTVCGDPEVSVVSGWESVSNFLGVDRRQLIRLQLKTTQNYSSWTGCELLDSPQIQVVSALRTRDVNCPEYYNTWDSQHCLMTLSATITGVLLGQECVVGNPCNPATGDKYQSEVDYRSDSLIFSREYHSLVRTDDVPMGLNWRHNFSPRLVLVGETPIGLVLRDGTHEPLQNLEAGTTYVSVMNSYMKLRRENQYWVLYTSDGSKEYYDGSGVLQAIESEGGRRTNLEYDAESRLVMITDYYGRRIILEYDELSGNVSGVITPLGQITYTYGRADTLVRVAYPDDTYRVYHYENDQFPHLLTGITDERGIRYATYEYDGIGRVISSGHAGGVGRKTLEYVGDTLTKVTDSRGNTTTYTYTADAAFSKIVGVARDGVETTKNYPDISQDRLRRLQSETDENGVITSYSYDGTRISGRTEAVGTSQQRHSSYEYDARFHNKATKISRPSVISTVPGDPCAEGVDCFIETYTYDDFGNRTSVTLNGFRPDGASVTRSISYQYNGPLNQLSRIDGPRTDVEDITVFDYYPNDPSEAFNRGRLQRITGPAGIVLRNNIQYTATGKVLSEDRPNGISLTYTYYAGNDRLETLTETSGGVSRTTRWTYLATGEVETITQADGTALATTTRLVYDDARRLTGMIDQLGNHIDYVLDTEGNRIDEKLFDSAGVLYKSVQQTFDIYNRLDTRTLVDETIDYNFQPDGSLDNRVNAKNVTTDFQYDALKRLTTTTGDLGGVDVDTQDTLTQYTYDAGDRLTSVTSPNNSNTTYSYDDLGNLLSETSPDRGLRSYRYDEAGNIKSITDARSITVNYSYDALNRVTNIDYPGTDEDITLTYDSATGCVNGVGKLCMVTDSNGTLTYSYTDFGNLAQQTSTISGIAYTTTYDYDSLNRITRITAPSGRIVTYGYDALGRTASIDATVNGADQTIAHDIQYRPDGLLSNITFANGFLEERFYNLKARMTSQTMPLSVSGGPPPPDTRTTVGLQALYRFQEGSGTTVNDVSGVGTPLNLDISGDTTWSATGLTLNSNSLITSTGAASKVIDAVTTSNAITVEAWITPANTTQTGPARIVSLSLDPYSRNFTLGQEGDRYDMRLRTTGTSNNGIPSVGTAVGTLTPAQTHIVYTRDASGVVNFYKDGILLSTSNTSGDMSNWDNSYRLALANELSADRGWLGSLHLVALYNRALSGTDVAQNFAAGPQPGTAVATTINSTSPGIPAQQSKLLILASRTATTTQPYTVWRKGKETNHQWMQTAEDPNAYDRPEAYLTPDNLNIWPQQGKGLNTLPLDRVILDIHGPNTEMKKGEYLNVSHGGTSPVSNSIDSETWVYTYDANGNVDAIDTTTGTTVYGYDALDRLTADDQPTQAADTLSYDRNGNRTNITNGVISMSSSYLPNSNQLDTLGGGSIGHDLAGNRTSDQNGNRTLEYNNAGRLFRVYEGGMLIATYTYNYQGQRTRKVTQNSTTVYHYDTTKTAALSARLTSLVPPSGILSIETPFL